MLSSRLSLKSALRCFSSTSNKKNNTFSLDDQPKLSPVKTTYHNEIIATAWVPKRFRNGIPSISDPTKVLVNAPVSYPLPIYSTEALELQSKLDNEDLANESKEISPLTQYGVFPASVAAFIALVSNEIFIINEESLIMITFGSFLFTAYVQLGGVLKKEFANRSNKLKSVQSEGLDKQLESVDNLLAVLKKRVGLSSTLANLDAASKDMSKRMQDMLVHKHTRVLHEVIAEKLNTIVTVQDRAMRKAHHNFVKATFNSLTNFTKGNKTFQDLVVKECINTLEKAGKPIEAQFSEFKAEWKSFASELAKSKKGKVEKDASTIDLIRESARLVGGAKLASDADINDYVLQLVCSVEPSYNYANMASDFKSADSKKKLGAFVHSWASNNLSSSDSITKSLASVVSKTCAPAQDTTKQVFDYVSMYQEYLMALRRFKGYELTDEQRSRIYRSVSATMKNEINSDFNSAAVDAALPVKNKLPAFSAYIAL